jgi:hypothetical protein
MRFIFIILVFFVSSCSEDENVVAFYRNVQYDQPVNGNISKFVSDSLFAGQDESDAVSYYYKSNFYLIPRESVKLSKEETGCYHVILSKGGTLKIIQQKESGISIKLHYDRDGLIVKKKLYYNNDLVDVVSYIYQDKVLIEVHSRLYGERQPEKL